MGGQHTICLGLSVAIAHIWRQCETKKLLVLWNVSIDMIAPVANDFVWNIYLATKDLQLFSALRIMLAPLPNESVSSRKLKKCRI